MSDSSAEFAAIYRRYAADVMRFALRLCGDVAEAEDLTSETFVRAWTSSTPIVAETVRAYLFMIARNLHLRRREQNARLVPMPESLPDQSRDRSESIEHRETIAAVEARLLQLSEVDRAAFRLRLDGRSYADIGAALGISEGAARVKVHRARAALAGLR